MMEKDNTPNRGGTVKTHLLTLDNRRRAALTGVSEVLGFDENQVSLMTENGEGKIDGVQYSAPRGRRRGLFSRNDK